MSWPAMVAAMVLAVVLPLCLLAGSMGSPDACESSDSTPGFCSKAASGPGHLLAGLALQVSHFPIHATFEHLTTLPTPTVPRIGFFAAPDGRAPPLL